MQQNDLISRKAVYEKACEGCTKHGDKPGECYHDEPCERLIFEFSTAPAVEAEPVRHGEWTVIDNDWNEETIYKCSICKEELVTIDGTPAKDLWNYCPNCGAKMDLEGDNGG